MVNTLELEKDKKQDNITKEKKKKQMTTQLRL